MKHPYSIAQLFRQWAVIVSVTTVVSVAAGVWSSSQPARYRAAADVLLPAAGESALVGQTRLVEASSELAATTAETVPGATSADVSAAVSVERRGTVLTIAATGANPSLVRDIADAHAEAYLALEGPGSVEGAELIRLASVPDSPVAPRPVRDGAVAGSLALGPIAAMTLLWARRRDRIRSGADVGAVATLLAELPVPSDSDTTQVGVMAAESSDAAYTEAIQGLFRRIEPRRGGRARRILIAGADDAADASLLAADLAWAAAATGCRAVVVGGDGRALRLESLLAPYTIEVPAAQRHNNDLDDLVALPGLGGREHLAVAVAGDHVLQHLVPTTVRDLCLLPFLPGAADADPGAMLSSDVVAAVLDYLDDVADIVIVDSPPVSDADDAVSLAGRVDDVVVVATARRTSRRALTSCIRRLDGGRGRVRGVVVTQVRCSKRPGGHQSDSDYAFSEASSTPGPVTLALPPATEFERKRMAEAPHR